MEPTPRELFLLSPFPHRLVTSQAIYGSITVDSINTPPQYPLVAAAVVGLALPFIAAYLISYAKPRIPAYDWAELKGVGAGDAEMKTDVGATEPEMGASLAPIATWNSYNIKYSIVGESACSLSVWWWSGVMPVFPSGDCLLFLNVPPHMHCVYVLRAAVAFTLTLVVFWPALTLPAGVFSLEYFTFYVALLMGWLIVASAIGILGPLVQYRSVIVGILGAWQRGEKPVVLATPSGKLGVTTE